MTCQSLKVFLYVCLSLYVLITLQASGQQTDTTITGSSIVKQLDPQAALRRAFVPGWGQLYNRDYYKVPIVYVGFAAFIGSAILVNRRYQLYRHAYLFTARANQDGTPVFSEYESDYFELLGDLGLRPESNLMPDEVEARRNRLEPQIRAQRDALRRNRDLLYFGSIAWYGFTVIDAFVSAHLSEFDVNESLTVQMTGGPERLGLTLTW
ncbi:MAG: DUF5683 domain-containing protein [Bacteroidetes bacterium]|nr:DUF5683 domain-containing protein [Bacteroidota bacterium]MCY4204198.1 DUF5683 domain-containing protein [Bacteroidota bacterium]